MRAKYKLLSATLALVGANSVIFPIYLGKNWKNTIKSLFVNSKNQDLSLNSINGLRTSNDQQLRINNPLVDNRVNQINTQEIKISPATEMKLEVSEESTNLIEVPQIDQLNSQNIKQTINQISREVKREDSLFWIQRDNEEMILEEMGRLEEDKENYESALSIVKKYTKKGVWGIQDLKCTTIPDVIKYCWLDKSKRVSNLKQEERKALKEFFRSYIHLSKKLLGLENRLLKSSNKHTTQSEDRKKAAKNKEDLQREINKKEERLTQILNDLQKINWDENEMLFKYGIVEDEKYIKWKEDWENNPFNFFFERKEKWEIHMMRMMDVKHKLSVGEINKQKAEKELENIKNEIILLIATNLLKRMKQIEISEEEREFSINYEKIYKL